MNRINAKFYADNKIRPEPPQTHHASNCEQNAHLEFQLKDLRERVDHFATEHLIELNNARAIEQELLAMVQLRRNVDQKIGRLFESTQKMRMRLAELELLIHNLHGKIAHLLNFTAR